VEAGIQIWALKGEASPAGHGAEARRRHRVMRIDADVWPTLCVAGFMGQG
jgi:hypothetical protein